MMKVDSKAIVEGVGGARQEQEDEYFKNISIGYRFCPTDQELLYYYLRNKVLRHKLPRNRIKEVNLYNFDPEVLAEMYKSYWEKEFYFFTPRTRKYLNGDRPSRSTGSGYWKATGVDKKIFMNDEQKPIGCKRSLVFYRGAHSKGKKTNWIMHEYVLEEGEEVKKKKKEENKQRKRDKGDTDPPLNDWVLCRIYEKKKKEKDVKELENDSNSSPSDDVTSRPNDFTLEIPVDQSHQSMAMVLIDQPEPLKIVSGGDSTRSTSTSVLNDQPITCNCISCGNGNSMILVHNSQLVPLNIVGDHHKPQFNLDPLDLSHPLEPLSYETEDFLNTPYCGFDELMHLPDEPMSPYSMLINGTTADPKINDFSSRSKQDDK